MIMYGHTLVWHEAIPEWVTKISTAKDARIALERHIGTLVSRYHGKLWAWDVVNEPIEPNDGLDNGYRNSMWFRQLGIDYVDFAFRLARASDAKTPLSLNEYGFEYTTAESQQRRRHILALLQMLRTRNTPVDCFGLQSHSCLPPDLRPEGADAVPAQRGRSRLPTNDHRARRQRCRNSL